MQRAHEIQELMAQKEPLDLPRFSLSQRDDAYRYFEDNGCVVFQEFLDDASLHRIQEELGSVIDQQVRKHVQASELSPGNLFDRGLLELARERDDLRRRLYDLIQTLPTLCHAVTNTEFLSVVRGLGIKLPAITRQFRMDLPGDGRFLIPPHQEVHQIRSPNLRFAIVALVDTPAEVGALTIGLASHKLGPIVPEVDEKLRYQFIKPEHYQERYPLKQVPLRAGEALFLHKYLIHGSTENVSNRVRWSLILRSEDLAHMPWLDGDDSHLDFSRKG